MLCANPINKPSYQLSSDRGNMYSRHGNLTSGRSTIGIWPVVLQADLRRAPPTLQTKVTPHSRRMFFPIRPSELPQSAATRTCLTLPSRACRQTSPGTSTLRIPTISSYLFIKTTPPSPPPTSGNSQKSPARAHHRAAKTRMPYGPTRPPLSRPGESV